MSYLCSHIRENHILINFNDLTLEFPLLCLKIYAKAARSSVKTVMSSAWPNL